MAKKKSSRWQSYFFLLINTVTWGAALIVVKPALDATTPFRFLLYRYVFATLLSLPMLVYYLPSVKAQAKSYIKSVTKKTKLPLVKRFPFLGIIGIIVSLELLGTTAALSLLYLGLARTSAIEASLLATTTPIFVVLAGILLLKEKQERHETVGLLLAFAGTILVTLLPLIQNGWVTQHISLSGNLLIIAQNTVTALYFILAKKYYGALPKLFVTTVSFYLGAATFFLLSWWETGWQPLKELAFTVTTDFLSPSVWVAAGYTAVFASIIGLTAYIKGQEGVEASEASIFGYLQPAVFIPLGILLLDERVQATQLIGLAVIIIGVVVAERRSKRTAKAKR